MFLACVVVTVLLALVMAGSAAGKFQGNPQVKQMIVHVGLGEHMRLLGSIELAGALGLIVGLFVAPIGIAAAIGAIAYFLLAILAHLRVHDAAQAILTPLVPLLFAIAALVLRLATA